MTMLALACAWGRRGITLIARLASVTLAESASPEGDCFFVFSDLRELTGLNEFSLIDALAEMQRLRSHCDGPRANSPIFQHESDRQR